MWLRPRAQVAVFQLSIHALAEFTGYRPPSAPTRNVRTIRMSPTPTTSLGSSRSDISAAPPFGTRPRDGHREQDHARQSHVQRCSPLQIEDRYPGPYLATKTRSAQNPPREAQPLCLAAGVNERNQGRPRHYRGFDSEQNQQRANGPKLRRGPEAQDSRR